MGIIRYKIILVLVIIVSITNSCASEGKPSPEGELLTISQIMALANDQSWNGKLVEVEGYPAFCSKIIQVTLGKKSKMEIYSEANCKGDKLMEVNVLFGGKTIKLSGEKERNFVTADTEFDNNTLKFTTDDYQVVSNGKFRFSGILIYKDNTYYLDNVTIHK